MYKVQPATNGPHNWLVIDPRGRAVRPYYSRVRADDVAAILNRKGG